MNKFLLKICGISTQADLDCCVELAVPYVGFNFARISKRYLQPEEASRLWARRVKRDDKTLPVGLFVGASFRDIALALLAFPELAVLQFHGNESLEYLADLKSFLTSQNEGSRGKSREVWIARPVADSDADGQVIARQFAAARQLELSGLADLVLLDCAPASIHGNFGGTGRAFNWQILENHCELQRFGVAGGIHPGNIDNLVNSIKIKPRERGILVDVASGSENIHGRKDALKIDALQRALSI